MRISRSTVSCAALLMAAPAALGAQQRVELPARDRPLTEQPKTLWSVGTDEGESWEMFANVGSLAFDRNDNLYVLDQGNSRVLVFDRGGRFVREFGKKGGGPGEFQFPQSIVITGDGSVVVLDGGRRGYSVFAPDGTFREIVPTPEGVGSPRGPELAAHPRGGIVVRSMPAMNPQEPAPTDSQASPVYRQSLDAKNVRMEHIYDFRMPPPRVITPSGQPAGRTIRMIGYNRPTFAVEPSWGILPDGRIAISDGDTYAIRIADASGSQRLLTRPIEAHRVNRRDQEAAKAARREVLKSGGGDGVRITASGSGGGATFSTGPGGGQPLTEEQIQAQLDQMEFADVIPAITRITVDPTGRIWVSRRPDRVGGDAPIDLLRADGAYVGTVARQTVPRAISASGLAAYIEKNDLDIEQIVVRQLPASWK